MKFTRGDRILMLAVTWNKHAEGKFGTIRDNGPETKDNGVLHARWRVTLDHAIYGDPPHGPNPLLTELLVGENEMIKIADMQSLETIW